MDEDESIEDEFKLPTTDRLKLSRKKRAQQLKKYQQHEKQLEKESGKRTRKTEKATTTEQKRQERRIQFPGSITLLEAAARNDKDEVQRLLRSGISADVSNDDGLTALHQCCIDDSESMLNVLLEFGANVNACDSELWTPLHAAATCGRVQLCKRLIEHGADLLAVNGDGNMPYDICEHEMTLDYIEYEMSRQGITQDLIDETRLVREKNMLKDLEKLHENDGDLEFRGRNGETPLHIAAANGYFDVAEFLLSHRSVHVDSVDHDLWQPIHCAACWGQLAVLELLMEHGASLEAKTRVGTTPMDICEDVEMKQKMLEIKKAIENSSIAKSRELSRRHSSTIRSASVRRTSMREKNEMSWKEAKDEARRMRESTNNVDDDDEDEAAETTKRAVLHSPSPRNNKSHHLEPLFSVDEVSKTDAAKESELSFLAPPSNLKNRSSEFRIDPPKSPEIGSDGGDALPGSSADVVDASSWRTTGAADMTDVMANGLDAAPLTLSALKKQRSSNRLSEMKTLEANFEPLESHLVTGSGEPSQPEEPSINHNKNHGETTSLRSTGSLKQFVAKKGRGSPHKDDSMKCCVIV